MKTYAFKQILLALLLLALGICQLPAIGNETRIMLMTWISIPLMVASAVYVLYRAFHKLTALLKNEDGVLKSIRAMFF